MYSEFLSHVSTYAACDKTLNDWHQGIAWYGFWAILVTDRQWLKALQDAQQHLKQQLLPGYARQAHITISASGLMHKDHFSAQHYQQQKQSLLANLPEAFTVSTDGLNSFAAAPYLAINDNCKHLLSLRSLLSKVKADDEPTIYHPHITLGFYQGRFPCIDMVELLKAHSLPQLAPLSISEIAFCRYQTHQLQGQIQVLERFTLTSE
jgi:2'-5' RNA ligase